MDVTVSGISGRSVFAKTPKNVMSQYKLDKIQVQQDLLDEIIARRA